MGRELAPELSDGRLCMCKIEPWILSAYTAGNVIAEPPEEKASRVVLKDIHHQVRTVLARIDESLAEIRASDRALADGSFRARVIAETRAWFDAHPKEVQGIIELFAPLGTA